MAPHGLVRLPALKTLSRISGNWSRRLVAAGWKLEELFVAHLSQAT
jgi:hypothetical protein